MSSYADLLTENDAAKMLRVSIKTLQGWRQLKQGPRYFKLSNRVRYAEEDLSEYLAHCAVEPERAR